ncbi:hypothetical protein GJV85_04785 [Sulfurimonas aquatica]|uniref:Sua5 YciO YrdC YwlC family protein n=1 Tax=Sulfurimonas aquatica TaxID=2672570 RepID=A0A975B2S4_9BACT|nr:hypothetical protein [Sulfurimonas aquatica]QSZ43068.1 hypothetical protein GJV85_04785 [Sulfurimonas aquatica]
MNVILIQTDTTVGFLSEDEKKLYEIKSRETTKPFIKVYKSFSALKQNSIRVPSPLKSKVRRSKKTTFIVKNRAFRVAQDTLNSSVLRKIAWNNSSSANESGKAYERNFCEEKADIIIEDKKGLYEGKPSNLYKINLKKIKRLR